MNIPKIKTDPNRPHHYIIGTRTVNNISSDNYGKIKLYYGPIYFTNEDVENYKLAIMLSQDKLLHTNILEALDIYNCSELYFNLRGINLSAHANAANLFHFTLEEKLNEADEWFCMFVNNANTDNKTLQKLKGAKIL